MASYAYRIVNVFAETPLSGNPLAVFEDARGMDDATMQALALQFNLSETTFILPSRLGDARVRIFTPTFEMPFAGHPTLGTAHVVRSLGAHGNPIRLEMQAGVIPVEASGDRWTLTANPPRHCPVGASREDIASALGIAASDIAADPLWVDTGSEQLIIPLRDSAAVDRCQPDAALLARHCANERRALAYVWAREGDRAAHVRFFFLKHGSVVEDPGTGSACANLGGYFLATGQIGPLDLTLRQGEHTGRPCSLSLRLDERQRILVGGRVIDLGGGTINLP